MKLKQVLEIEKVLGKTIPVDMAEKWVYYSNNREIDMDIMEIDIIHAIRIIRKYYGERIDEQPDVNVEPLWLD